MNPTTAKVLELLRKNVETDLGEWGCVYLDNACPDGMNRNRFAGYLSALEAKGLYRPVDGFAFGDVRMAD